MDISFGVYILILLGMFGVSTYFMSRVFQNHAFIPPVLGFIITKIISGVVIGMKLEKRNNMFLTDFPDAIDMIVRSVRSGHPLLSSLGLIAQNSRPPLSTEFQRVIDEVSYGRALSESLRKMADRIGIIDINFFVVILSVQQETGGSLAEVLNNLSTIIRKRKQLRLKIKALTSEGRITAKIFAFIPLAQLGIMRLMYQNALDPLFNTNQGLMCLGVAGFFIIMAIFIANKMCNVDV
jgi:tight adherence protein B